MFLKGHLTRTLNCRENLVIIHHTNETFAKMFQALLMTSGKVKTDELKRQSAWKSLNCLERPSEIIISSDDICHSKV